MVEASPSQESSQKKAAEEDVQGTEDVQSSADKSQESRVIPLFHIEEPERTFPESLVSMSC